MTTDPLDLVAIEAEVALRTLIRDDVAVYLDDGGRVANAAGSLIDSLPPPGSWHQIWPNHEAMLVAEVKRLLHLVPTCAHCGRDHETCSDLGCDHSAC